MGRLGPGVGIKLKRQAGMTRPHNAVRDKPIRRAEVTGQAQAGPGDRVFARVHPRPTGWLHGPQHRICAGQAS